MTSVAAEQFHREYDPPVHYGPVWRNGHSVGESLAACANSNDACDDTMSTYIGWVTCQACKEYLANQKERL
jgi:hypothetical protein